jgi:hypothetical protein
MYLLFTATHHTSHCLLWYLAAFKFGMNEDTKNPRIMFPSKKTYIFELLGEHFSIMWWKVAPLFVSVEIVKTFSHPLL